MNNNLFYRLDWLSVFIYICLVSFGLLNIYSTTYDESTFVLWNISTAASKQLWIFIGCLIVFPFVLYIKSNFFEHLSYIFYALSIFSLIGLFIFGQTISGATSWYNIGGFSLQPAEFAKITTALVIADFLSGIQTDIRKKKDLFKALLFILLPVVLIILQPDAGSALVFFGLFFVFIREGLDLRWLFLGVGLILIFIATLLFKPPIVCIIISLIVLVVYHFGKKANSKLSPYLISLGGFILFSFSVDFIFNSVF